MFGRFTAVARTLTTRRTVNVGFKPRGFEDFFENGVSLPKEQPQTGRAWRASELRNKSWEDLQKLWYVLLKERNLLASQNEEAGRLNISRQFFSNTARVVKCKKSMARIRTVLNERRLAYVQAEREAIRERKQMRTELIRENTLKNLEKKGLETGEVNSPPSGSVSKQVAKETVQAAPTSSPAQPSSSQ